MDDHRVIQISVDGTVSVFNRIPIYDTHFRLQQRHNPNMSILSTINIFVEMVFFSVLLLENTKNGY